MFKMDQGWYFLCHVRHLMKFKLNWVLPTPWNYFLFQVCLFGCSNLGFWSVTVLFLKINIQISSKVAWTSGSNMNLNYCAYWKIYCINLVFLLFVHHLGCQNVKSSYLSLCCIVRVSELLRVIAEPKWSLFAVENYHLVCVPIWFLGAEYYY